MHVRVCRIDGCIHEHVCVYTCTCMFVFMYVLCLNVRMNCNYAWVCTYVEYLVWVYASMIMTYGYDYVTMVCLC